MGRRERWREVLDAEMRRWSAMSCEELVAKLLDDVHAYEVEVNSQTYQVEVELLENTDRYLHVMVAVDDGSLFSLGSVTKDFIREKPSVTA
jgi:hypothetical protein